jgi:hypothetical protein
MQDAELLPTLAEIAVAFAGFASLVSILGGRSSGEQLAANIVRLRGMLQSAVFVLAFSLAPFLPARFGASDEISWRIAGVAFALFTLIPLPFTYRRVLSSPVNSRVAISLGLMRLVAGLVLAISVAVLPHTVVVGAYHLSLLAFLATSSILFMRVVTSAYGGPAA